MAGILCYPAWGITSPMLGEGVCLPGRSCGARTNSSVKRRVTENEETLSIHGRMRSKPGADGKLYLGGGERAMIPEYNTRGVSVQRHDWRWADIPRVIGVSGVGSTSSRGRVRHSIVGLASERRCQRRQLRHFRSRAGGSRDFPQCSPRLVDMSEESWEAERAVGHLASGARPRSRRQLSANPDVPLASSGSGLRRQSLGLRPKNAICSNRIWDPTIWSGSSVTSA